MLQLRFQELLSPTPGLLRLVDVTGPYAAGTNPGGYGGPNPLRADVAVFVLLACQQPGRFTFDNAVPSQPYDPLTQTQVEFSVPLGRDGVYQAYAFAVSTDRPQVGQPAGSVGYADGELILIDERGDFHALVFDLLSFDDIREAMGTAATLGQSLTPVLVDGTADASLDEMLLLFVQSSRDLTQQRQIRERYLSSNTHLDAVRRLFALGRFSEASAQLAALTQQQRAGLPYQTTAPTTLNSWNSRTP